MASTRVILNDFGGGALERRTRTSASGKTTDRYVVSLDSSPFGLNFDTKDLGAPVARAIADHLKSRVANISASAAPETIDYRKKAEKAFQAGASWTMKRYAGGRTGPTPPNQSTRIGNDSGRLAGGITVGATKDNNWVINVPVNRLNAKSLGSEAAVQRVLDRIRQFVPEFGSANELTSVFSVRRAIKQATEAIYVKKRDPRLREFAKGVITTVIRSLVSA